MIKCIFISFRDLFHYQKTKQNILTTRTKESNQLLDLYVFQLLLYPSEWIIYAALFGSQWAPAWSLETAGQIPLREPPTDSCSCLMLIQLILDAARDKTHIVINLVITLSFWYVPLGTNMRWFFSSCSLSSLLTSRVYNAASAVTLPRLCWWCQGSAVRSVFERQKQRNGLKCQRQRDKPSRASAAAPTEALWMPQKLPQSLLPCARFQLVTHLRRKFSKFLFLIFLVLGENFACNEVRFWKTDFLLTFANLLCYLLHQLRLYVLRNGQLNNDCTAVYSQSLYHPCLFMIWRGIYVMLLHVFFQTGLQSHSGSGLRDGEHPALSHSHLNSNSDEQREIFVGFGDQQAATIHPLVVLRGLTTPKLVSSIN